MFPTSWARFVSQGGGVAKTARRLPAKQTIGSAILPTASRFFLPVWLVNTTRRVVV
jgi:hypothetical protein